MNTNYNLAQISRKILEILASIYNAKTMVIDIGIEDFETIYFDKSTKHSNCNEKIDTDIYDLADF